MNVFTTGMNGQGGGTTSPSTQTTRGFLKASREVPAQTQAARPRQASASNMWTITTTTGKQYSIDNKQFNWIKNRYQQQMADTYGFDDADQLAKRNGQLSASALKTYKNSNVDRKLAELGLPSEKNLEKYLESYNQWHTGGMDQVFGQMNLPKNYWTNVKGWYQSDMQNAYENTAEDQQRKARGLIPSKWEAKYTDTEIDDQLRARGLPPISEFNTYRDRWNNYTGIENFYTNVALADTNLRLQGINDDDKEYEIKDPQTGEVIKKGIGKDLYAESFHNELKKTNEDGSYVYGNIMSMFQNRAKPSSATPSGDYAYDLGAEIVAANKEAASDDDYASYNAFSYDDYKKHYDDLYNRYFANQQTTSGQLVSDAIAVKEMEADEAAEKAYYTVGKTTADAKEFATKYLADHPTTTVEEMLTDMAKHNVPDTEAHNVYWYLKGLASESGLQDTFTDVVNAWIHTYGGEWSLVNDSDAPIPDVAKPLTDEQRDAQRKKDMVDAAMKYADSISFDKDNLFNASERIKFLGFNNIEDMAKALKEGKSAQYVNAVKEAVSLYNYAMEMDPGTADEQIRLATAELNALGFDGDNAVADATKYVGGASKADPASFVNESTDLMISNRKAVKEAQSNDTETIDATRAEIESQLFGDVGAPLSAKEVREVVMEYDNALVSDDRAGLYDATQRLRALGIVNREAADEWLRTHNDHDATEAVNPNNLDVDGVIQILDAVKKDSNPVAFELALKDLGFNDGDYSGAADDLTYGWSDADKRKLAFYLGGGKLSDRTYDEVIPGFNRAEGDTIGDAWADAGVAQDKQKLNPTDFSIDLEWVLQQVNAGKMTEEEGYNLLAANGYQKEMEYYMPEEWHRAHFIENTAPGLWNQSREEDQLLWEEMTPEQQREASTAMWDRLTDEQKASMYRDGWWEYDPSVYRTFGQALEQQFRAVLPGLAAELIGTPVKVADAIGANISGRPNLWKTTETIMKLQQGIGQLGAVTDNVNGAKVAQVASDVAQEILKMEVYGTIGGMAKGAFTTTKVGSAIASAAAAKGGSKVVKKAADMFLGMVGASPFVVSAFAGNYTEAKAMGASNSEAAWFGMITGLTEGILEGFEFDELWGKTINGDKFAQQLLAGAQGFKRMGIVGKARVASMVVSGLGEFTEESIGYVVETALKMRHSDTWGKGTEWSANDWLEQAMMGFLTGALGGGLHSIGSITADSLIKDYAMHDEATFRAVFPDLVEAVGRTENLPEATRRMYEKGGATVLSADALQEVNDQIKKCDDGIANAPLVIKGIEDKAQKKIDSAYEEVRKYDAKLALYASMDTLSGEDALIFSDLIDKRAAAQRRFEAESKAIRSEADEQIEQAKNALKGAQDQKAILEKKVQEHWAGVYFSNKAAIIDGLTDEIVTNLANSYQNGSRYEAADLTGAAAEGAELVRKGVENPAQSKLAEAEANETMAEAEQVAQTPEDAATKARELAYDRVYKDQEAGKAYAEERRGENDSKMTRVEFAENERQNFQAKTTAKLRRVTLELAGLEAKEGMSAKEIFEEAKKAMTPEASQKLDMYQKLSKALGLNMVVRDVVAGTSGYVHDGKLYVTLNGKQSMLRVAAHELTHYMKGHASEQYDALRTSLVNEVGQEKFDELLQEKAQEYGLDLNDAKARLEADDEVCAELCEKMLENKDALEKFAQSDLDAAKTLKQRLAKTLVAIKSAIRSIGTSNAETKADLIKQQDTIEQWYKGLSDAIDNANNSAKAKAKPVTETVADTTTKAAPKETRIIDPWTGEEINLWSKSYKDWGYEGSSNSNYAVYLALKQVNPEMAKAYEDGADGGPQDVLKAVINIANDVRQEQISPMAAATLLSNQYNADKSILGSLFNGAGNATEGVLNAARQIDEERNGAITELGISAEDVRKQNLRSELEELAKKGTKVQDVSRQEINDVLDRVILGDKSNYNKADYAQIRGMLAQLIPEVQAYVNGDESVDADALNERLSAAIDYMLGRYSEGSEDYYGLRELIPSKIALTDTAYKDLRAKDMTLRQASNELTKALGGKFVNFVYKKAPSYNNAMTIDELWQTITDQYGEQNGVGNIGEDALALIDYVRERADNRTSFNDLYGSQREDMVNTQVGEFLDAVQSMVEGKSTNKSEAARYTLDPVEPIEPTSDLWSKTATTAEAKEAFPDLWDVSSEESEDNNPTQRKSTESTYRKIYDILRKEGFSGKVLDASSGMGYGTRLGREEYGFDVDDIEPYPGKNYNPMYKDYSTLNEKYDAIISSAVLNVLPQDQRDALVVKMGKMLNPGGKMYITTRGTKGDVDNLAKTGKNIQLGPSEFVETVHGSYQKGFTNPELKAYLEDALGPGFTVEVSNKDNGGKFNNNTSIVVTKNGSDVLYALDDDYMPLAERYDAGIATEAETEELNADVAEAARDAGYDVLAYHGTSTGGFNIFDYSKMRFGLFGEGFYFTEDPDVASSYMNKGKGKTPQVYKVFLRTGNEIDMDAEGNYDQWAKAADVAGFDIAPYVNEIEAEKGSFGNLTNTDYYHALVNAMSDEGIYKYDAGDIVQGVIREMGFDGIRHIGGLRSGNGKNLHTVHIVFNSEDIKSAAPVTYDKDGNIIPLSERFDPNKTDIRWTVDDDLADLVEQYGAIEQGREPRARDVQVPRQSADNMRTSKLTRSLEESSKVTNEQAAEIQSEIGSEADRVKQLWSYIPKSNDETMRKAKEFIAARQPATAQREFHDMVVAGKYGTRTAAIGLQLLSDASARDDWASVKDIAYDLRVLATEAGQSAQIFNVLKDLKGVGSAWYVEKLVNSLNSTYADEIASGQMDPITVSEEAMQKVRAAKTQAEVDAAEKAVADEIGPQLPLKRDEKLSNWRYLSMLGNPVTHIRNVTGNNLMYGMGGIKDVVASGIQRIFESAGITDEGDRTYAYLSRADKAYWDKFAQESYDEQKRNLQGGGKLGFQSLVQQSKRSFDNKVLDTIARGKDPGTMSERKGLVGLLQNIRNNGAMGMLEVEDAWGLEKNYKRSLMEYMKAQGYSLNDEGKVGKVGKDGSFTEITNEQMNKAIEWATNQAWTNTFRGPSALATELNKISKMNTASKFIIEGVMPFKKTPINIAKQGAMYSPAGIVIGTTELLTKVKQGKMSAATAIDHLSSGLTGTALMALGVVLAKAGILRGGGDDKKKLETYLEDTGDQTYAFKFGNVSINMSAIAPATIPLFMGVALQEMLSRNGDDEGVDLSTITDVLAGTLNPFMEMSFMSSLNSALKNYNNEGIGGALGSTIMTAAQNYGSQYLPTLGGKVAQFIDPTQRTTKSSATSPVGGNMDYYWRSLVKKVPGAEATLQPDVNVWGQTTTKDSFGDWALDFANKFILPTNIKVTNRDAVDNELIRVVESTGIADFLPSDGAKYFKVKGETYKMNASQYTQYSQERGQAAYAALKDVMAGASYKTATDEQKAELLKKALDNAYKSVNNVWKEKLGAYDK